MRTARATMKMTMRSIRSFFGRYLALLFIVLLSVGFFAGLKVTKPAMQKTCGDYLEEQKLYDLRILGRTGFLSSDIRALSKIDGIRSAEGGFSADVMAKDGDRELSLRIHSLQKTVNLPSLTAGRMPEKDSECLADRRAFTEQDIGKKLSIDAGASGQAAGLLNRTDFTIVGLCDSPMYLSSDRGTSTVGSGTLDGYLYVPKGAFIRIIFTEVDLTADFREQIYSDRYDDLTDSLKDKVEEKLRQHALSAYVLTRRENAGYLSFENDTAIVSGIANIFPLFFVMIGMLVCITAMTRMVEEERTQIGILKALGYSPRSISAKYDLYAAGAALIGWTAGFFLGTWGLPQVFWLAYSSIYGFTSLPYRFDPVLAAGTLAFVLAAILLSTMIATRRELSDRPAELIRPRNAAYGKRILLERIRPLWKRLSFLQKITLRNMFRYKQRLFMMLIGISCCAGLVVTGFGVKDSLLPITSLQYDQIQKYDMEVSVASGKMSHAAESLRALAGQDATLSCSLSRVSLKAGDRSLDMAVLYGVPDNDTSASGSGQAAAYPEKNKSGSNNEGEEGEGEEGEGESGSRASSGRLSRTEKQGRFRDFWNLGGVSFPGKGEAAICVKAAQSLRLSVGDPLEIQIPGEDTVHVKVSGIFENYIGTPVMISADTLAEQTGSWEPDTVLVKTDLAPESAAGKDDARTSEEHLAKKIGKIKGVTAVDRLSLTRKTADHALACVHYIIFMLVLFAGGLEFIVVYNLTSINLAERSREIATVEVLGFYPGETDSYVLRENLVLTILASLIGIPLGNLFHSAVMNQIIVKNMVFDIHIRPVSYLLAVLITVLFGLVVNLAMRRYIRRIPMAESLKAVE